MEPYDRTRAFQQHVSPAVPSEEGVHPAISAAPASASTGAATAVSATPSSTGASPRPPGVSSVVPDAFCCVHPLALEQRQQQNSGDWMLRATTKAVRSEADLRRWLFSDTHAQFLSFVGRLARHAAGKKTLPNLSPSKHNNNNKQVPSDPANPGTAGSAAVAAAGAAGRDAQAEMISAQSGAGMLLSDFVPFRQLPANKACWALIEVLQQLLQWVDEIPPIEQPTRFGNQAFKTWCRRLEKEAEEMFSGVWAACEDVQVAETEKKEMVDIFCSSFGNPVRLDFGTGHECSFAIFLFCLFKKNILKEEEHDPFAVLGIFKGYVQVAHALQQRYMLEAAGSRGVWGLDDFHFLTFLWGAGQLSEQQIIEPAQ
ncbi:phosphotyrosyl phosphatase activator, putative, partial [Eimeria maxima]